MKALDGFDDTLHISGILDSAKEILKTPIGSATAGAVLGGAVVGGTILTAQAINKKSKSSTIRKKKTKKGSSRDRKYISKQKHEVAYQRRRKKISKKTYGKKYKKHSRSKSKSKKGIHYTKNGQPYKILANGRARFIKKARK